MSLALRFWIVVCLVGCQSPAALQGATVYEAPDGFLGQNVRVCGYLDGASNIYRDDPAVERDDFPVGLSVIDEAGVFPGVPSQTRACLVGTVVRLGCGVELLCNEWAYEYDIRVKAVEHVRDRR